MLKDEILVVEDELSNRMMIDCCLAAKYKIIHASDIKTALEKLSQFQPKMILLDLYLPDGLGFDLINHLEQDVENRNVPVLLLTLEAKPEIKAKGFALGIYDYIVKPFSTIELLARVEAHLSRSKQINNKESVPLQLGEFNLNDEAKQIHYKKEALPLTPLEFKLLSYFMKNKGKVVSRDELAKSIWMKSYFQSRTIDRHISSVRKKMGDGSGYIETVSQAGYRFNFFKKYCIKEES